MKITEQIKNNIPFDDFISLWIEQETDKCDDKEQLIEELEESLDYNDLFQTISLWSHKPLNERLTDFVKRNNINN